MPMKIVTLNLPDQYIEVIQMMVDAGLVSSRSEAIRSALTMFLRNEAHFKTLLTKENISQELQKLISNRTSEYASPISQEEALFDGYNHS